MLWASSMWMFMIRFTNLSAKNVVIKKTTTSFETNQDNDVNFINSCIVVKNI